MILTLISLAELEGIFRGLYFFSKGGASVRPELLRENKQERTCKYYNQPAEGGSEPGARHHDGSVFSTLAS